MVIIIVGIVASLSAPSMMRLIRTEREAEELRRVAAVITEARALAMGRGSAVLVRYPDENGNIEVREALEGTTAGGCTNAPALGCVVAGRWDNDVQSHAVDAVRVSDIHAGMKVDTPRGELSAISLCFTPQGRTWAVLGTDEMAPLKSEVSFVSTNSHGIERRVLVLPTGVTRYLTRNTLP